MADPDMWRFTPALRHADLWYDHLLVDERVGRLVAAVDWEAAALGDPAREFAAQFYLGDGFAGPPSPATPNRVARLIKA